MKLKYFKVEELVNPTIFKQFGSKSIMFIDDRIITAIEIIREEINTPIIINNWHNNGEFENSGLRAFNCPIGAEFSQHKFGRAMDLKQRKYSAEQLRQIIKELAKNKLKGLVTGIELKTDTWVHIDCRNTGSNKLMEFNP
jgi:hypothetical protein